MGAVHVGVGKVEGLSVLSSLPTGDNVHNEESYVLLVDVGPDLYDGVWCLDLLNKRGWKCQKKMDFNKKKKKKKKKKWSMDVFRELERLG